MVLAGAVADRAAQPRDARRLLCVRVQGERHGVVGQRDAAVERHAEVEVAEQLLHWFRGEVLAERKHRGSRRTVLDREQRHRAAAGHADRPSMHHERLLDAVRGAQLVQPLVA